MFYAHYLLIGMCKKCMLLPLTLHVNNNLNVQYLETDSFIKQGHFVNTLFFYPWDLKLEMTKMLITSVYRNNAVQKKMLF